MPRDSRVACRDCSAYIPGTAGAGCRQMALLRGVLNRPVIMPFVVGVRLCGARPRNGDDDDAAPGMRISEMQTIEEASAASLFHAIRFNGSIGNFCAMLGASTAAATTAYCRNIIPSSTLSAHCKMDILICTRIGSLQCPHCALLLKRLGLRIEPRLPMHLRSQPPRVYPL